VEKRHFTEWLSTHEEEYKTASCANELIDISTLKRYGIIEWGLAKV